MNLTVDSLKQFDIMQSLAQGYDDKTDDFLQIDPKAKEYLLKNLDINVQKIEEKQRALSVASSRVKLGQMPKPLAENWMESQSATKSVKERPQTAKEKSLSVRFSELDLGLKKLTFWIRQSNLDTEDVSYFIFTFILILFFFFFSICLLYSYFFNFFRPSSSFAPEQLGVATIPHAFPLIIFPWL